jgi:RecB family exonuclease
LRVVEEAILAARVAVGRFGDPAVYIGALRDAVGLRFAAVRVIGLAEGHLPSVPREDPVIPDALRDALGMLPTAADRALEGLHALDSVVRNADRRIALSAPRLDVERSQREPSSVILEAAAALARPNRATGERGAVIPDRAALQRDAFAPARDVAAHFRRELPVGEAAWHDGVAQVAFGLPQRWRRARALDLDRITQLAADGAGNVIDGLLGALVTDLSVPGLSPDRPISPSAIAALLGCPHAFLHGQILGFEEPAAPPPQREIGQLDYGYLFHAVAADFYTRHGRSFCSREGKLADWIALADALVDCAFQEFLKTYPLIGGAVRAEQRRRLRRDVRELLQYDWKLSETTRFIAAERAFGEPNPIELQASGKSLYLRGRIDRIDVDRGKALVRDLKTARPRLRVGKEAEPQPGIDLQIAAYGMVTELLAEEWKVPKRIAVAYAYFGRGAGAERPFRDDFDETLEPAARQWLGIAAGLLEERLFPRTPNPKDCDYCSFRPVCGEEVYERARGLLAEAEGVLADFASRKLGPPQEED